MSTSFFTELADVLDHVSTFADPLILAGDLNLRLERQHDPHTVEFNNLLAGYDLHQQVVGATHDAGGILDVVCTRSDLPAPTVEILDVGLSDHRLLRWTSHHHHPPPVYMSTSRRCWRSFDADVFLTDLQSSPLCDEQQWQGLDADALAELYDKTIGQLLDDQAPVQHVTCRRRPTSTWFGDDCRKAKRALRSLEKVARRAGPLSNIDLPAVTAWRDQRRQYLESFRQ